RATSPLRAQYTTTASGERQIQDEGEPRAAIRGAVDVERTAHRLDQRARNREAEPSARKPDADRRRAKTVEQHRDHVLGNSATRILNPELDGRAIAVSAADRHEARVRIAKRVRGQIEQHPMNG